MAKRKEVPPKPQGCRICKGAPWVETKEGMKRCDCPSGVWYRQRDSERVRGSIEQQPVLI